MPVVWLCVVPICVGLAMIACARYRIPSMGIALVVSGAVLGALGVVQPSRASYAWVPSLGWTVSFVVDGLSMLMAVLICGIGVVVIVYTHAYMHESREQMTKLYGCVLAFLGAMLGVVFADDALVLFVCWELTSVLSFALVAFWYGRREARAGAWRAIAVTALGGIALLVAIGVAWTSTGSWRISAWVDAYAQGSVQHVWLLDVALLIAVATKSAQMPFARWLPGAMAAPTPVSAYLHAATLVKAGVYVLARMGVLIGEGMLIGVVVLGACTAVWGAYGAMRQMDAKRMLAHSTVSQLGVLCMMLGIAGVARQMGMPDAVVLSAYAIALYHLVHHACTKGALFMVVGIIDRVFHTRDVRLLTGAFRRIPAFGVVASVAMAMFVGVPVTSGFMSKEAILYLFSSLYDEGNRAVWVLLVLVVLAMIGTFGYGIAWIVRLWARDARSPRAMHERIRAMLWMPPVVLIVCGMVWGLAPQYVTSHIIDDAVRAIVVHMQDGIPSHRWTLWHGVTWSFAMTIVVYAVGVTVVVGMARVRAVLDVLVRVMRRVEAMRILCTRAIRAWMQRLAHVWAHMRTSQGASVLWIVWASVLGLAVVLTIDVASLSMRIGDIPIGAMLGSLAIICAAIAMVRTRARLVLILALGAIGLMVSLLYVWLDAPDLALTQLAVEAVSIVLFLTVLRAFAHPVRTRITVVPLVVGVLVTALSAIALIPRPQTAIEQFYAEYSVPLAKGANVVNVILVDFRGLDTMLEIVVIAIAACAIVGMMVRHKHRKG